MADEKTFAEQVNEIVSQAEPNDKGSLVLSEDVIKELPEHLAYAAQTELRHRNTQSAYTRAQQEAKTLKNVNSKLTEHLTETVTLHLTHEQRTELDTLKKSNPEKWREKLNEHEQEARRVLTEKINSIQQEGQQLTELELRQAKLESFKETSGIELTDDIIANDLPAAYSKDLEEGKISFDEFLTKAQNFLTKNKVIKGAGNGEENDIDLGKVPGAAAPEDAAVSGDIVDTYRKTIF